MHLVAAFCYVFALCHLLSYFVGGSGSVDIKWRATHSMRAGARRGHRARGLHRRASRGGQAGGERGLVSTWSRFPLPIWMSAGRVLCALHTAFGMRANVPSFLLEY